jgi:hypothetical protein
MYNQPNSPFKKQKLSPQARRDKAARDLAYANSPARKKKRADSQAKRRAAEKAGRNVDGKDYDHKTNSFKSVASNRGNDGEGTKKEGGKNYRVDKAS